MLSTSAVLQCISHSTCNTCPHAASTTVTADCCRQTEFAHAVAITSRRCRHQTQPLATDMPRSCKQIAYNPMFSEDFMGACSRRHAVAVIQCVELPGTVVISLQTSWNVECIVACRREVLSPLACTMAAQSKWSHSSRRHTRKHLKSHTVCKDATIAIVAPVPPSWGSYRCGQD